MLERRQLTRARVLLPTAPARWRRCPSASAPTVLIPPPIPAAPALERDDREPIAVGYTPDPKAKGLALLCAAWEQAGACRVRGC